MRKRNKNTVDKLPTAGGAGWRSTSFNCQTPIWCLRPRHCSKKRKSSPDSGCVDDFLICEVRQETTKMFSRIALRKAQALPALSRTSQVMSSSTAVSPIDSEDYKKTTPWKRPVRLIDPAPVRFGFIPDNWFTFFYPKTGVTGPYMFGISFGTYLLSKEWYVVEHEFYTGASLAVILVYLTKTYGKSIGAYFDSMADEQEAGLQQGRNAEIKANEDLVEHYKKEIWRTESAAMFAEAKKESVKIQLESEYRARLASVYNEVKRRLDYQVQKNNVERQFEQKHMAQWIIDSVNAALTPDLEKSTLQNCIKDLQSIAATAKA